MKVHKAIGAFEFITGAFTLKKGICVQRLYSSFARGWPGTGLVLLRFGAGILLMYFAIESLTASREPVRWALDSIAGLGGILLLIGLWTPVAGIVAAVAQLLIFLSQPFSQHRYPFAHILLVVLGAALAMLGPGAWSIDARLFGRKRVIREP